MSEESKTEGEPELNSDIFKVDIPPVLSGGIQSNGDEDEWIKVKGWYNELSFYSRVFQFFGESIKEKESMFGWWIILISTFSSFITLVTLDPFSLDDSHSKIYDWSKNIGLSLLSVTTTLIASWVKKKGYVSRIQAIDKRISKLEKFIGELDYQYRLVPTCKRQDYCKFITDVRQDYNELSIYTHLIQPSEFAYIVYLITRFHAPTVKGQWPWYNTDTGLPRPNFAQHIIETYEKQYSCSAWIGSMLPCSSTKSIDSTNPLLEQ